MPTAIAPLSTLKVLEFEGIGPGPMCGMMLAGLGAKVTVVKRPTRPAVGAALPEGVPPELGLDRGKTAVLLDLKSPQGVAQALDLVARHDALIEGLRPGAMERLGLGPEACHAKNTRLVYGRMTGWGQSGPLAHAAGHDLNYVALTGLLGYMQRDAASPPTLPPTMLGDAVGALGLAFGITSAALHAKTTGQGSVVDAAMVDITAMLGALIQLTQAAGGIGCDSAAPLQHSVFHGSPFYDSYRASDGRWLTVCALEPPFYALLLQKLQAVSPDVADLQAADQFQAQHWPQVKARFTGLFASQPLQFWRDLLEGSDVCFAPVLTLAEAAAHPHVAARGIYQTQVLANGRTLQSASAAPRVFAA